MKKEKRNIYLELSMEINASLCCFCKYGQTQGCYSICDAEECYYECSHPIENLSYGAMHEIDCLAGDDCYGFTPSLRLPLFIEFISVILSNGFDEWVYSQEDGKLELQLGKKEGEETKYYSAIITSGGAK